MSSTTLMQETLTPKKFELFRKGQMSLTLLTYVFSQDFAFSAPTPAAQVVCGNTANGRTAWKQEDGNATFADWQGAQLSTELL